MRSAPSCAPPSKRWVEKCRSSVACPNSRPRVRRLLRAMPSASGSTVSWSCPRWCMCRRPRSWNSISARWRRRPRCRSCCTTIRRPTGSTSISARSADPRRFTDLYNAFGERFVLFAGLDDVAFEGLCLGARGWVSGLTNAFPRESLLFYEALRAGDLERARLIYRWFMPLLHLDAEADLVQSIKLAESLMGRGSERVRPPRLPLAGQRREQVTEMVRRAAAARPV